MSPEDQSHASPPRAALPPDAAREKSFVALTSVGAAIILTGTKIVVGLATGSLGLLAEAAHSGLDLVAAVITFFAVRAADKPADAEHPYGHGKVENLSALVETLLLFVTCGWIVSEAVRRLFFKDVPVEASIWAFIVIAASIVLDVSRSRALQRIAKKHRSQALEADALHFSTDVWSSAVVLLGLVLVKVGDWTGQTRIWERADAVAALLVALLVAFVSLKLGRRTIDALIDRAPVGVQPTIEQAVLQVEGIMECRQVRLRQSGNQTFADVVIGVRRGLSLESSHSIGHAVEQRVQALLPNADVVVHVDPVSSGDETLVERIRSIAVNAGQTVHNVVVSEEAGRLSVELHLEADADLELHQAHARAHDLEAAIRSDLPAITAITTHIEPARGDQERLRDVTHDSEELIRDVRRIVSQTPGVVECHKVIIRQAGREVYLTMHCTFAAGLAVRQVHNISTSLEQRLRGEIDNLVRVTIHPEPFVRQPGDTTRGDD